MKTRINQILLPAIFAFFLIAGNIKAEGTERHIALSLEIISEPALELEAWMLDENYWINSDIYDVRYEDSMNLEDWMINGSFFNDETIKVNEGTETELEIESWMVDANFWDLD